MPHDVKGLELQPGDIVRMEFEVKHVTPNEDHCNVTLAALNHSETEQSHLPGVTCNSRLVEKARPEGLPYHLRAPLSALRESINAIASSRERACALTKLDEAEMWLARC